MQTQRIEIKRPPFPGGLMGLRDLGPPYLNPVSPKDSQGLYYNEVLDKRHHSFNLNNNYNKKLTSERKKRGKKLTDEELQLALSIVGMIKDDVESDLSENFREYLRK